MRAWRKHIQTLWYGLVHFGSVRFNSIRFDSIEYAWRNSMKQFLNHHLSNEWFGVHTYTNTITDTHWWQIEKPDRVQLMPIYWNFVITNGIITCINSTEICLLCGFSKLWGHLHKTSCNQPTATFTIRVCFAQLKFRFPNIPTPHN